MIASVGSLGVPAAASESEELPPFRHRPFELVDLPFDRLPWTGDTPPTFEVPPPVDQRGIALFRWIDGALYYRPGSVAINGMKRIDAFRDTGDRRQLEQALLNIVRNASQALHGRGTIKLRTRVLRSFNIGPRRYRLVAQIQVIDNGPGIDEEFRKKIFYPMVTSRNEGTGLGLSIAQSLISRHEGLIECSSKPGKTTFTVLLPLDKQKDAQ